MSCTERKQISFTDALDGLCIGFMHGGVGIDFIIKDLEDEIKNFKLWKADNEQSKL